MVVRHHYYLHPGSQNNFEMTNCILTLNECVVKLLHLIKNVDALLHSGAKEKDLHIRVK